LLLLLLLLLLLVMLPVVQSALQAQGICIH